MNPDSIQVRSGELEDVIGNAHRHDYIAITSGRGFHAECMEPNTQLLLSKLL